MFRHACLFIAAAVLLSACAGNGMTGDIVSQQPSPDGKVIATLTRQGDTYRLYLSGKNPPMAPWEMLNTEQFNSQPRLAWWPSGSAALEHACGHSINFPHGTGTRYPIPDAEHGVGVGFSNQDCRR